MNSFLLLDANPHPSADFPEAITLNLCIAVSLRPRPVQTTHSATSQGAGPQRANTGSATWGHLHHSRCLQTSRVRGQKQGKKIMNCLVHAQSQHKMIYPGWNSPLNLPPGQGGEGKFTFNSLHTWKKKYSNTARHCSPKQACVPVFQL